MDQLLDSEDNYFYIHQLCIIVSPSILAWFIGASTIERHITLDRSMWGTDQSASLSEDGIRNLTSIIFKTPEILGDGKKKFSKKEKNI